ncbi:MAG: hypothetical protein RL701_417 [Pseudomonadota bacterium]
MDKRAPRAPRIPTAPASLPAGVAGIKSTVVPGPLDRRARRSEEHSTALRYQLERTKQRGQLDALALTDRNGLLVAWAGESEVCEELGAVAPLIARGAPVSLQSCENSDDEVVVRAIECFGEPLFLASIGGNMAREALLAHSARGIRRILTAN